MGQRAATVARLSQSPSGVRACPAKQKQLCPAVSALRAQCDAETGVSLFLSELQLFTHLTEPQWLLIGGQHVCAV